MSRLIPLVLIVAVMMAACSSGPAPRPVTTESLDSGEETARQAADFEAQGRSAAETVIYASSRDHWHHDHGDDDETSRVPVIATIYVDREGRILDSEGELFAIDELDDLFDPRLSDEVLGMIIDPHVGRLDFQLFAPLIEAVEDHHGLLRMDFGQVPEFVGDPEEDDEEEEELNGETDDEDAGGE